MGYRSRASDSDEALGIGGIPNVGLEIDFLAVGDGERGGDAIAIRFGDLNGRRSEQVVIVVDGGWTETGKQISSLIRDVYATDSVDLAISTHPDDDHSNGLLVVLDELKVGQLAMHLPWEHTDDIARMFRDGRVTDDSVRRNLRRSLDSACALSTMAKRKGIAAVEPFAGTTGFSGAVQILGPDKGYYESLLPYFRGTPEPTRSLSILEPFRRAGMGTLGLIIRAAESLHVETLTDGGVTSPENNSSVITFIRYEETGILLTGDAGTEALTRAADQLARNGYGSAAIDFIQVPHHGSKRNVGPTILDRLVGPRLPTDVKNKIAMCSCPKDSDKHPARRTTNAFRRRGAPVWATKGVNLRQSWNAPARQGYGPAAPLPLFSEVEDD